MTDPDAAPQRAPHPEPGEYEHYKGPRYEVLCTARHSETEEEFVVYRQLYGERGTWVRPLAMFTEMVEVEGRRMPRFRRVGDAPPHPGARPDSA